MRVGNLLVRSLSPRVENVWVRTPQVGNMVWHVFETSRSEKSQYFVDNYCYTWITSSLAFTNYQPCRYVVSVDNNIDKVLLISTGFDNLKITTVVCWYTPWRYYFWLISPWQRKRDGVGFMDKNLNLFGPTLLMCLFLLDTLSDVILTWTSDGLEGIFILVKQGWTTLPPECGFRMTWTSWKKLTLTCHQSVVSRCLDRIGKRLLLV